MTPGFQRGPLPSALPVSQGSFSSSFGFNASSSERPPRTTLYKGYAPTFILNYSPSLFSVDNLQLPCLSVYSYVGQRLSLGGCPRRAMTRVTTWGHCMQARGFALGLGLHLGCQLLSWWALPGWKASGQPMGAHLCRI